MNWLAAIQLLAAREEPAVLVTVASVEGSAPREPGAKMLVTRDSQFDTIGGGHMEMRACELARDMLEMSSALPASKRRLARFPLGPSLGQCCGGVVHLAFERVDHACYEGLNERWTRREDSWRVVALDDGSVPVLLVTPDETLPGSLPGIDRERGCHVAKDAEGRRWLVDPCLAWRSHLVLFGAGHVGAAIVRALADLPCHVTWVDEREDMFPADVPANVAIEATDIPEAVVDSVPSGASYLVMTHSHALDQQLCEAILRRRDRGWFGLIGSKTKRMQFEHRLRERGIAAEELETMICPVGIPGISGKAPAVIAASVCAQLLQVWEEQAERWVSLRSTHPTVLYKES
ncbi:xanthine dehydrogenase accessory protein XdhC [Noviherbaspirillum sp.]|uniref:xanthine dehydrogenase accessory protein XdhC n=1 Tax=Noviherbaspirillum sp. TaxID=1926288 RepID=UPI002D36DE5A|nr:xanthine dehydrogenase accessory protein XdhC [Noviherbaspirillum sp.]HZW20570.1 xanthine dehydrogenase accessory protein XdhC [Noviherbaspirillum sp.]